MDLKVQEVQNWLNYTYYGKDGYVRVEVDGLTGIKTVEALIRALQIELNMSTIDGVMEIGTMDAFNNYFSGGLSTENYTKNKKIVKILTGGFYCKGINPGTFTDIYNSDVVNAVKELESQIGINQTGIVNGKLMAAVLTTDPFIKSINGDDKIREIQQSLNRQYSQYFEKYISTTGIVERSTMEGLIKAVQFEIGATVDGWWGEDTMSKLITIPSANATPKLIYLLQYALYINGYNPNGFDGLYGNGVKNAIIECQKEYLLDADGYCGKMTWAALLVSCGDINRSANACDTRFEVTDQIAKYLKADGYNAIGRYIVGGDYKELRNNELQTILNNGLSIFLIYQKGDDNIKNFGPIEGGKAAIGANGAVIKHKIPNDNIVYFAVDTDVYEDQIDSNVIPYFRGINEYKSDTYKVGIYAPRLVCQRVISEGLAVSCFVSDASYKYSCNIGQKIPQDWNLDQFYEIKNYKGLIDLDKVMYSGRNKLVTSINETPEDIKNINEKLYKKLEYVYDLAKNYVAFSNTAELNLMVLLYFKNKFYNGPAWDVIVPPMPLWAEYVNAHLPEGEDEESFSGQAYIYDKSFNESIDISHLSCTTAALMENSNEVYIGDNYNTLSPENAKIVFSELQSKIVDLCGWAGDLIQLLNQLKNNYTAETLLERIGAFGGTFSLEDFIQDIDAVNLFRELKNKPIKDVFHDYYEGDNNRIDKFIENRNFIGHLPDSVNINSSAYDISKALAYQYVAKQGLDTATLVDMFGMINYGSLDSSKWKDIAPEAWAKKINSYITT